MSKGKYAKYVMALPMPPDFPGRYEHVGKRTQHMIWNRSNFPEATHHIESYIIYAPGFGFHCGREKTVLEEGKELKDLPISIPYDEISLFIGTDPKDPTDLGGEVEFWMGEGKNAEKYIITKTSGVFAPAGLVHLPVYFRKVNRPFIFQVIIDAPEPPGAYMKFADVPPGFSV